MFLLKILLLDLLMLWIGNTHLHPLWLD